MSKPIPRWEKTAHALLERLRVVSLETSYDPDEPDESWIIKRQLRDMWLANPKSAQFLIEQLENEHPQIRKAAVRGLWTLRNPQAESPLVNVLLHDSDRGVRAEAARALGAISSTLACETLLAVAKENLDDYVTSEALRALANCPSVASVEVANTYIGQRYFRYTAIHTLGAIDIPLSTDYLVALLTRQLRGDQQEIDEVLCTYAAQSLGKRSDTRVFPILMQLLTWEGHGPLLGAIMGLGDSGDPRAIQPLQCILREHTATLHSPPPFPDDLYFATVVALAQLGDHSVADRLLEIISEADCINTYTSYYIEAVNTLVNIRESSAVPYIEQALQVIDSEYFDDEDEYDGIVTTLQQALQSLTNK